MNQNNQNNQIDQNNQNNQIDQNNVYTEKRIKPEIKSLKELTKLKQIDNVEDLFFQKLDELFKSNSHIRYDLIKLFDTTNDNAILAEHIINQLRNWNIELECDITGIHIQKIMNYLR